MDTTSSRDPVWNDLAAIAFEFLAKSDDRAREPANGDTRDADHEEGE
ncbi:MAG TPA: hypothetical protein VGU71_04135 [Candidatus Dormibacteraeota bacterium]|nr:hypothetical protein [Candidatus Dormibacteraeota bacterium]